MPKNRIHKGKDGRYTYAATDTKGKRLPLKSRKGESRKAFAKRCDELDKIAEQEYRMETLDDLFNRWHTDHVCLNLSLSEQDKTRDQYERYVRPYLGKRKIVEIKQEDIHRLITAMQVDGYKYNTVRLAKGCISRPYNWARKQLGIGIRVPTEGVSISRKSTVQDDEEEKGSVISPDDLERFRRAARNSKHFYYFEILRLTGMRPSEALGLQYRDVSEGFIHVRRAWTEYGLGPLKTSAAYRKIPITPEISHVITQQRKKTGDHLPGWFFPAESGEPSMSAIQSALTRCVEQTAEHKLGGKTNRKKIKLLRPPLHLTLYDFRHTFATRMAEQGCHQKALQSLMGHKSISVTLEYYIGITDKLLDQAKTLMEKI